MTTRAEERALCFAFGLVARARGREDESEMLRGLRAALRAVSEERGAVVSDGTDALPTPGPGWDMADPLDVTAGLPGPAEYQAINAPLVGLVTAAEWTAPLSRAPALDWVVPDNADYAAVGLNERSGWEAGGPYEELTLASGPETGTEGRRAAVAALRRLGATVPEEADR